MKRHWLSLSLLLLLLALLLTACGNNAAPTGQLNDDSLKNAPLGKLETATSTQRFDLTALNPTPRNEQLGAPATTARISDAEAIGSQGLELPNSESGFLVYIGTQGSESRIVKVDMSTLEKTVLFTGQTTVQSVAITGDGNFVSFIAELNGNFEVFAYDLGGAVLGSPDTLVRLTDTASDEADISLGLEQRPVGLFADQLVLAWQGLVVDEESGDSLDSTVLAALDPAAGTLATLGIVLAGPDGAALGLLEPTVSGSGEVLVGIVELADDLVVNLNLAEDSVSGLVAAPSLASPSLNYDGSAYTVLAGAGSGDGGTALYFELASEDIFLLNGAADNHPFLTASGDAYAYGYATNIFTSPLGSDPDRRISETDGYRDYGAYWAKAPQSSALLEYTGSNDEGPFVRLPEDGLTEAERTVFYDATTITVPESGWYEIKSIQNYDGYLNLYRVPFNPDEPATNLLASNDDLGAQVSAITYELLADSEYVVVTSACGVSDICGPAQGTFENSLSPTDAPPPLLELPEPDNDAFNITLRFADEEVTNSLTAAQREVFVSAAAVWSNVITGDVANIENFNLPPLFAVPGTGAVTGTLDDVLIDVKFSNIDGPGNILGRAGPRITRDPGDPDENLTVYGTMEFDIEEFGDGGFFDDPQQYSDVIVHEMGHVIGIGTLWQDAGLAKDFSSDPPTVAPGLPNPAYNPRFTGAAATAEYQALLSDAGKPLEDDVPVANTGGPGNYNGHWRELVFDDELMTPYAGGTEQLSRMTAASLADLGYEVDLDAADGSYALPIPPELKLLTPSEKTYVQFEDYLIAAASPDVVLAGSVVAVDLTLDGERASTSGCEAADFSSFPAGSIALVQRGTCTFAAKVENAEAAGAIATIIFNQGNTSDDPEDDRFSPVGIGLGSYTPSGPVVGASFALGEELAGLTDPTLSINTGVTVSGLSAQARRSSIATQLRLDLREELLRPTATISSDGKIKPID